MRKKTFRTAACLLLAAVVLASFAALASGGAGSQGDPLVTLSYLNDTFLTQVLEKVDKSLDERGGSCRGGCRTGSADPADRFPREDGREMPQEGCRSSEAVRTRGQRVNI